MKRDQSSGVSREFGERVIKTDRGICDDGRAIYQARCGALAVLLKVCPSKIKMLKKQTNRIQQVERVRNIDGSGMV